MNKGISLLGIIALVLAAAAGTYFYQEHRIDQLRAENKTLNNDIQQIRDNEVDTGTAPTTGTSYTSKKGATVIVTTPTKNSNVASPLTIAGEVPGTWAFEAEFLIRIVDADNKTLAEAPATLQGDWMTSRLVPFTTTLTFDKPANGNGAIILIKANPSGLEEHEDTLTIPVKF